jgi:Type I phosphodiesterase / nucleotide pyrophosphatase
MIERRRWSPKRGIVGCGLAACVVLVFGNWAIAQVPGAEHAGVIGIDGLSLDCIHKTTTPHLHQLMKARASILHARAVMPTVSSPICTSMIMGAGPEQHRVNSNDWEPDKLEMTPIVIDARGTFLTIFSLLRSQRTAARIACFHDWEGFSRLFDPKATDVVEHPKGPVQKTDRASA